LLAAAATASLARLMLLLSPSAAAAPVPAAASRWAASIRNTSGTRLGWCTRYSAASRAHPPFSVLPGTVCNACEIDLA
jgi:hypothetical protein